MAKLTLSLLTLALVAACTGERGRAFAAKPTWDVDDDLQRQEAMAEAVRVLSNYDAAQDRDETAVQRAGGEPRARAAAPIFKAVSEMPEKSAADVRSKEEARAAANELLARHLGQLLPGGGAKIVEEL